MSPIIDISNAISQVKLIKVKVNFLNSVIYNYAPLLIKQVLSVFTDKSC